MRRLIASLALLLIQGLSPVWGQSTPQGFIDADVGVAISDNPDPVSTFGIVEYTINVSQAGPDSSAQNVVLIFNPDPALFFLSVQAGTEWTCDSTGCTATAIFQPGAPSAVVVSYQAPQAPSTSFSASVSAVNNDPNPSNNQDTENTSIFAPPANLSVLVTPPGNTNPAQGEQFSMSAVVSNAGSPATGIEFVVDVPSGLGFISGAGTEWSCGGTSTVVCSYAGGLGGEQSTPPVGLSFEALGPPGAYSLTYLVSSIEGDTDPGDNQGSLLINVGPPRIDLTITKSTTTPGPFEQGEHFFYAIQVVNGSTSSDDATGIQVVDTLPAGMEFIGAAGAGWSCSEGGGIVTCNYAPPLPPFGSTPPLQLEVKSLVTGIRSNVVQVTHSVPDNNPADDQDSVDVDIVPATVVADVRVVLSESQDPVFSGQAFDYLVQVTNNGPDAAALIEVTVNLPFDATFSSATAPGYSCSPAGSVLTCNRGSPLAPLASEVLTISMIAPTVASSTIRSVSADAFAETFDPNFADNSVAGSTTFLPPPGADLALSASSSPVSVGVNDPFVSSFSVVNNGPDNVTSFDLVIQLPANANFTGSSGSGFSCSQAGGVLNCAWAGSLPAAGQADLQLDLVATTLGTALLDGQLANCSCAESDPTNDNASTSVDVVAGGADLVLGASSTATNVLVDDAFSSTFTVSNSGPDSVSTFDLDVQIPANVSVSAFSGTGFSCAPAGAVLACKYSGAAIAAGGQVALQIDLIATALGSATMAGQLANCGCGDPSATNDAASTIVNVVAGGADVHVLLDPASLVLGSGATGTVTLSVGNSGPDAVGSVTVAVSIPANVTLSAVSSTGLTCTPVAGGLNCSLAGGIVLASGSGVTADLQLVASGTGSGSLGADISSCACTDPVPGNDSSKTNINVLTGQPDFAVRLTDSADPVARGASYSYRARLSNTGDTPGAPTARLVLPPGTSVESLIATGLSCSSSTRTIDCTPLTALNPAQFLEFEAILFAPNVDTRVQAELFLLGAGDTNAQNDRDVESTQIGTGGTVGTPTADLNVVVLDSQDPALTGEPIDYLVTVSNAGPFPAQNVHLSLTFSTGLTAQLPVDSNWNCQQQDLLILCALQGDLSPGETQVLAFPTVAAQGLTAGTVDALVSSDTADPVAENNKFIEHTQFAEIGTAFPDLRISVVGAEPLAVSGEPYTLMLRAENIGTAFASGVHLDVNLCPALSYVGVQGDGWQCTTVSSCELRCAREGGLIAGAISDFEILALGATPVTDAHLQFQLTTSPPDSNPDDNHAVAVVSVQPRPPGADLQLEKFDSADPVEVSTEFDYQLKVRNLGPDAAHHVVVHDPIPEGLALLAVNAIGFSCQTDAQLVRCEFGSAMPPETEAVITIRVRTPDEAQSVENIATVESATADPHPENNTGKQSTQISGLDADDLEDLLRDAAGDSDDPGVDAAIEPIARLCARLGPDFAAECAEIIRAAREGRRDDVLEALRAFSPDEMLNQSISIDELARAQFYNLDARLAELRAGGGGGALSMNGLNLRFGDQMLPLGMMSTPSVLRQDGDSGAGEDQGLLGGLLSSRWGAFVNGTFSAGERDARGREVEFDFETYGLTAGLDYRVRSNFILGGAIGYALFDSDFANRSRLETQAYTLTAYSAWYPTERTYLDARLSYGSTDFEQSRRIQFDIGPLSIDRAAEGDTSSDQLTAAVGFGYQFQRGAWNLTPSVNVRWLDSTVDGFTETGAGPFNIVYADQEFDSLLLGAGLQVSRAFSFSRGVLTPQLDLQWHHETRANGLVIEGRLLGAPENEVFRIEGEDLDKNYASIGFGVVFVTANGRQFYLNYRDLFGLEEFDRYSINFGARFEF